MSSLSDKIWKAYRENKDFLWVKDVKEAVKEFLDFFGNRCNHTEIGFGEMEDKAEEIFGEKLIK